jgi:hypothetical protein
MRVALGAARNWSRSTCRCSRRRSCDSPPTGALARASFLGAEAGIARRFGVFELELVRYQLSHTAYEVRDGQVLSTLFESWQLQPGLSLGAGYVW